MDPKKKSSLAVAAVVCMAVLWLSTSVGQNRRSYEIEAQVYTTPEYRTDAARAIDAYERVMQRYMDATERNFMEVIGTAGAIADRLDSIDARLAKLDQRLERIERHLGIVPPPPPIPDPNGPRPQPPVPTPLTVPPVREAR
ncbi:MAG: hypothetical protein JW993_11100 [Sedimentisphaerales bacterium]|nr:hypothetical protein [Sedimentisphaerales bacterium]